MIGLDDGADADTVDAVFEAFGDPAHYEDGSSRPAPCLVIPWRNRPSRDQIGVDVGGFPLAEKSLAVLVRASEIPTPAANALFRIDGGCTLYRIGEAEPVHYDSRGFVWRCATAREFL